MSEQRVVKMMEDSQGRQLFVEISNDIELSGVDISGNKKNPFTAVTTSGDKKLKNSLPQLVADTTSSVLEGIEKMVQPSKITIELGVEVGGEAGFWFITKASASSAIKVSIEYEFPIKTKKPNKPKK